MIIVFTIILMGIGIFQCMRAFSYSRGSFHLNIMLAPFLMGLCFTTGLYTIFTPLYHANRMDQMVQHMVERIEHHCVIQRGNFVRLKNGNMICLNPNSIER